jgi:hypothetical protein
MKKQGFFSNVEVLDAISSNTVKELIEIQEKLSSLTNSFEQVIVWNAGDPSSRVHLEDLVRTSEIRKARVLSLIQPVDDDVAAIAGIEVALGDYVIVSKYPLLNPDAIGGIIEKSDQGYDSVVFNDPNLKYGIFYGFLKMDSQA